MTAGKRSSFGRRALELHASTHIWNHNVLERVLQEMAVLGYNTLVLHEVQIAERLVYPGRYFGSQPTDTNIYERYRSTYTDLYRYTPGRRSKPYLFMETMRWLVRRANRSGIDVFLNNKELFFPDIILELQPGLMRDGVLCPTDPFWLEFLEVKYAELLQDLPAIAGVITAPGTGESRLSITSNRCRCERCATTTPQQWYRDVLTAIHRPVAAAGKQLVVRDFVFDKGAHDALADAFEVLPADVAVCLKNTPHDYYPTFPDNPRIGQLGEREQWVELDAMGQYFGWGIAPAPMIEDYRGRLRHALRNGVSGVLVRVDWESLDGHSAFETPNHVNVVAGARLADDVECDTGQVWAQWLTLTEQSDPDSARIEESARVLERTLGRSWEVVGATLYADGCVFSDSSSFPVGLDNLFWLAETKNSLADWDSGKSGALSPTRQNILSLTREKEQALALWHDLRAELNAANPGLRPECYADLLKRFDVFGLYVEGFVHIMAVAIRARHVLESEEQAPEVRRELDEALARLADYLRRLRQDEESDWFPATHLVCEQRLRAFHDDVVARLESAG